MIRVAGDTHGDPVRFIENNMGDNEWTSDDYLIVCGDFGFIFRNNEAEREFLDYLETKPYTICFCDGNHENFPAIFSYPKEKWNGGYVHRIRKNVLHLMRGQVFEIDGRKVFTMGGAYFNFDIHNMSGSSLDETGVQAKFTQQNGYTIPYGCLFPEKIDGLLLSGRNISGTHMAHSNFRAMPICMGIGEAGGAAAAIAVKKNIPLREVSPKEIQQYLV